MQSVITIDRRFCGPPESANGGYACGVAAAQLASRGAIEVTLRSPPPLDAPIDVERAGERAVLRDRAQLVAEVVATTLAIAAPEPVHFDDAACAAPGHRTFPFATCFVCGPARAAGDGLRIFPGAVAGRNIAAAPWIPAAELCDSGARVRPEIVWSVLDCPSWFGFSCFEPWDGRSLLGRMAAELYAAPRAGERCVCAGWFVRREGRKVHAGSALFGERGELHALAQSTWIILSEA